MKLIFLYRNTLRSLICKDLSSIAKLLLLPHPGRACHSHISKDQRLRKKPDYFQTTKRTNKMNTTQNDESKAAAIQRHKSQKNIS